MPQLELAFDGWVPAAVPVAERRIDLTLDRLRAAYEAASDEARAGIDDKPYWNVVLMVSALRAMERGEEEALSRPSRGLADVYDLVVSPGEHPIEALLRTFRATYLQPVSTRHA